MAPKASSEAMPPGDASVFSLLVAILACKIVGEPEHGQDTALVEEDLPVRVDPESSRGVEVRLDKALVELRKLCDQQRRIVLEEAEKGSDCALETQELHRLGHRENDPPLQTKIVSTEEVLRDVEGWWNPMLAEYQALVHEKRVVVPVSAETLAAREAAGERFQVIPAKLIFTLKAFTARRKVRCVGCGNYLGAGEYTAAQLYAGGVDVISLRCSLVLMVDQSWFAVVADIKTAFLNAELQPEDLGAKKVVIRAPGLWRRLGICEESFWDVHRAMYGLAISPAAWARCRDRKLPSLRLETYLGRMKFLQFKSDSNIWAIVPEDAEDCS